MATHELWKGREELRSRAQKEGERWFNELADEFKGMPDGTLVAINVDTGEFVTATDQGALLMDFKKRFGDSPGWLREIHGMRS